MKRMILAAMVLSGVLLAAEEGSSAGPLPAAGQRNSILLPPESVAISTGEVRKFEVPFVVEEFKSSTGNARVLHVEGRAFEIEGVAAGNAVVSVSATGISKEFRVTVSSSVMPIYRELASGPIPTVFLCRLPGGVESGSLAIIDNRREFCRIVQRLYREGCRKFAFFTDIPPSVEVVQERFAGFLDGMRRCRLKPQETLLCLRPEQQQEFLLRFSGPGAPDAVCCHNDRSALELMKLLRTRGIDYSKIRFTGYDNLSLLRFLPQKLLTAELPLAELGKAAAEILLRQIENRSFKPVCKRLPARIKES